MTENPLRLSAPLAETGFDRLAASYDDVAESALGVELRGRVHSVLETIVTPGDVVADLGCGSGIDAEWLASRVASVSAFDVSSQMVRLADERCEGLDNVTVHQADVAELQLDSTVDVLLVNFGVVNCVGDLGSFADRIHTMLKPSGTAVVVSMGRWCPIELTVGLATLNRGLVKRRSSDHRGDVEYEGIDVQYASAARLEAAFEQHFVLTHAESLGLVLPPFEQRGWVEHRSRLRSTLAGVDRRLGRIGARLGWGDHHVAVFVPTGDAA